jgi:hypothetical protein
VVVVAGRVGVLSTTHPVRPNRPSDSKSDQKCFMLRRPLDLVSKMSDHSRSTTTSTKQCGAGSDGLVVAEVTVRPMAMLVMFVVRVVIDVGEQGARRCIEIDD